MFHFKDAMKPQKHFIQQYQVTDTTPISIRDHFEVIFAVHQCNPQILQDLLLDRSHPTSSNFRKWLSYDEITYYCNNTESYDFVVYWLQSQHHEMKLSWTSPRKDYIKVIGPLFAWEKIFHTKFYIFQDISRNESSIATKDYFLPNELNDHIAHAMNLIHVPMVKQKHYQTIKSNDPIHFPNAVTIPFLNEFYEIPSNIGDDMLHQAVFSSIQEKYSQYDINTFQDSFDIPNQQVIDKYGDNNVDCSDESNLCSEGNLDLQYLMGICQETKSIFWYVEGKHPFLDWILQVASELDPPSVHSISYGQPEYLTDQSLLDQFSIEAMKLGIKGVTIVVSSGDAGVADEDIDFNCQCDVSSGSKMLSWRVKTPWKGHGYFPLFPSSNPYVTVVGGTMGPNNGEEEVVCQADKENAIITSGGGFSMYYPTPSYQDATISHYFNTLSASPSSGYNRNGRGYPDIAILAVRYPVVIGGKFSYLYGTSASTPVFAGMISLINANRIKNGQSLVGFINPTLYFYGSNESINVFRDVVIGSNNCCSNDNYPIIATICCAAGFNATKGWLVF